MGFSGPAGDTLCLALLATALDLDLLADLAVLSNINGLHDELHAARFTGTVLAAAVLTKVAPLPVAAVEFDLVEKAHCDRAWRVWKVYLRQPRADHGVRQALPIDGYSGIRPLLNLIGWWLTILCTDQPCRSTLHLVGLTLLDDSEKDEHLLY